MKAASHYVHEICEWYNLVVTQRRLPALSPPPCRNNADTCEYMYYNGNDVVLL